MKDKSICGNGEEEIDKDLLKSCPGCEGNNVVLEGGSKDFDRVQCGSCGITGPWFDGHPLDAINGWNSMPRCYVEQRADIQTCKDCGKQYIADSHENPCPYCHSDYKVEVEEIREGLRRLEDNIEVMCDNSVRALRKQISHDLKQIKRKIGNLGKLERACKWTYKDSGLWETGCGKIDVGTSIGNCPWCEKPINVFE